MSNKFTSVNSDATVKDVLKLFLSNRQSLACVFENGEFVGIITKYSLYRLLISENNSNVLIKNSIIRNVVTLKESDNTRQARKKMISGNVANAVVLNDANEIVGIVSNKNVFQSLIAQTTQLSTQLGNLVNNLQSAIISVDTNLEIVTLNNSAAIIFNDYTENLIKKNIKIFLPIMVDDIKRAIDSGIELEHNNIYFNNTKYIYSLIPIKAWNQITGVMIVLDQVSKYEKIANELETTKRIEQTLDSALEVAYDGVIITNPEGIILKVNQGFVDLLELSDRKKIIGVPLKNVAPEIPIEKSIELQSEVKGEYIKINNQKTIVTQSTIYRNGKNIGIIVKVLFQQLDAWKDLFNHMDQLENEISYYRSKLEEISVNEKYFSHVISSSEVMKQLKHDAHIAAKGFSNILITGESGTGKDLFAQGIHNASGRKGNFIKINCAAIPKDLLESELFGYEEGAFTGAKSGGKVGKFELAHNGTLFLDEVGDMPISLQVKLLRVLQDQKFERVGGIETKVVDVRIITATNRNLIHMIREGSFREDLYYRINVIHLKLPPLRDRREDIPGLCNFFINKFNKKSEKEIMGISQNALRTLMSYDWPGNIRELENVIERSFQFSEGTRITSSDIDVDNDLVSNSENDNREDQIIDSVSIILNPKKAVEETERNIIIKALKKTGGNRTEAAKILKISRSNLYYKLNKYNIS